MGITSKTEDKIHNFYMEEENLEKIQSLSLEEKFNVAKSKIEAFRKALELNRPATYKDLVPGQPPVHSDQGTEDTCVSHSLSKLIVDVADHYGLDTDQTQIQEHLIEKFQPLKKARNVEEFIQEAIGVLVWEKEKPEEKHLVNIAFKVETDQLLRLETDREYEKGQWTGPNRVYENKQWTGPKMNVFPVHQIQIRMVVEQLIIRKNKEMKKQMFSHALYATSCTKESENSRHYKIQCIGSWGEEDEDEILFTSKNEVYKIHYISLYSM